MSSFETEAFSSPLFPAWWEENKTKFESRGVSFPVAYQLWLSLYPIIAKESYDKGFKDGKAFMQEEP